LGLTFFFRLDFAVFGCGGLLATTFTARSKRSHASGSNLTSLFEGFFAMANTDIAELRKSYWTIMTEIKQRLEVIHGVYKESKRLPGFASRELVYLQIRMICELIGLACLTAHGDMAKAQTKNIRDTHEPGKILKHLDDLHPLFYPRPVDQLLAADGALDGIVLSKKDSLSKTELPKLYGLCGDVLHQHSISKFNAKKEWNPEETAVWVNKIISLLNRHFIVLSDQKRAIYIMMQTKETGKVTVLDLSLGDASQWPNWFCHLLNEE
jgi:hypothetical protein